MRLEVLLRRWRRHQIVAIVLRALGVAMGAGALLMTVTPPGAARWLIVVPVVLVVAITSVWLPRPPMANRQLLASHLDRVFPGLEDSTGLVAHESSLRTGLELLQARRVREILDQTCASEMWPRAQMLAALKMLSGGVVVALLVFVGHLRGISPLGPPADQKADGSAVADEFMDPLQHVTVEIHPPAYTHRPPRQQNALEVEAVEGSLIRWSLPPQIDRAFVAFAGRDPLAFDSNEEGLELEMEARESNVYQLVVPGRDEAVRSGYSRLTVIPDALPTVRILSPSDRVTLAGDAQATLDLSLEAEDDHGLDSLELVSTLAQGSGESVEFRQHRQSLRPDPTGTEAVREVRMSFDELGLADGSELYFFVEARDNRQPEPNVGRSATYIVRVPEERVVTADLGEGLPIVLPPGYFRSQRQIILDTEKLIAGKSELSAAEFGRRSEGLGFDQRALRMRYGTLLGEEFESGRPVGAGETEESAREEDHEHEAETGTGPTGDTDDQNRLEGVPSDFVHFHDSAEIATFFTSEIRTRLKQVLAQMWDAEGRLRVHEPGAALPYEYRALELLKDLQHRSRIYVQKVGFETPPLEPEKLRLTGELEDIQTRRLRITQNQPDDPLVDVIGDILAILQQHGPTADPIEADTASLVRSSVAQLAASDPTVLMALTALDRWVAGEELSDDELQSLTSALWRLVPEPVEKARRLRASTDPLAQMYRAALSEGEQP